MGEEDSVWRSERWERRVDVVVGRREERFWEGRDWAVATWRLRSERRTAGDWFLGCFLEEEDIWRVV